MTAFMKFVPKDNLANSPSLTAVRGRPVWTMTCTMMFYHGPRENEYWVNIPSGYATTGASVLSFMRNWLRPCDQGGQAVIIHDFLCKERRVRDKGVKHVISIAKADEIFLEAMEVIGVPWLKRRLLFWAARLHHQVTRGNGQWEKAI